MRLFRSVLVSLAVAVTLARAAELSWPDTELGRHAHAWFDMLKGSESDARQFLSEHMAASALADASVDERLERRAGTLARTGGLTPLEVVDVTPASVSVRCRTGNGEQVTAIFEGEPASPHKLLGVRIQMGDGDGPPPPSGPKLSDKEGADQMRAWLDSSATASRFSGVALLARGDAVLMSGAWGQADRAGKGVPSTLDTRFNLGSIGKIFTRLGIAQLAEAGKLSLDDKLSRYLPDFPNADSITLDMLVMHRSGVGDFFNDAYDAMDKSKLRHNHDYLALIRDQPLWFAPGTSERYSNGGYALLGEVIAKVSGEDYYEYLAKHLFTPAGMKRTLYPIEGDGTPNVARGFTAKDANGGERDNQFSRPARGSAAGGGYSTAADLLKFDKALLAGRLCGSKWAGWVSGDPRPDLQGSSFVAQPGGSFGFAGGAPGISSEWQHEGDLVLIVLTNRDPELTRPVLAPLHNTLRRMTPTTKKVRS